jgi:NAD(P)H-nitrite reductase
MIKMSLGNVIVGNSAAGISALEAIRQNDLDTPITLISDENLLTYSRVMLPYFIKGDLREEDLFIKQMEYYDQMKVKTIFGRSVVKVKPEKSTLILDNGEKIGFEKLLIASGSSPVIPKIEGINSKGIFCLRTLDDARKIASFANCADRALMIGGGPVTVETAAALHSLGLKITFVVTSNRILSRMLDQEGSDLVRKRTEANGGEVLTERKIVKITGNGTKKVFLDTGEKIDCDMIVVGKGVKPNIGLVENSEISVDKGILIDDRMRTNLDNIYAAGDVAQAPNLRGNGQVINAIWPNAIHQGEIAGLNMSGQDVRYKGSFGMNIIETFGTVAVAIGRTHEKGEVITQKFGENYRKFIFEDGKLVGSILVGDFDDCGIIQSLIKKQADVRGLRDLMSKGPLNLGNILMNLYGPVK